MKADAETEDFLGVQEVESAQQVAIPLQETSRSKRKRKRDSQVAGGLVELED